MTVIHQITPGKCWHDYKPYCVVRSVGELQEGDGFLAQPYKIIKQGLDEEEARLLASLLQETEPPEPINQHVIDNVKKELLESRPFGPRVLRLVGGELDGTFTEIESEWPTPDHFGLPNNSNTRLCWYTTDGDHADFTHDEPINSEE